MSALLSVNGLSKHFGALKAVDNLSFDVGKGEALGILGPNGAGKSTLFNLITGDLKASAGVIRFQDQDITNLPSYVRCRRGIGRSYQIPKPFGGMTVFENVLAAASFASGKNAPACYDLCIDVLGRTGLLGKSNSVAGQLTLLERKRLELARALATNPTLLLLDEIAGGLTEGECQELLVRNQTGQSKRNLDYLDRACRPRASFYRRSTAGHRFRQASRGGRATRGHGQGRGSRSLLGN